MSGKFTDEQIEAALLHPEATPKEAEYLELYRDLRSGTKIAKQLGVSPGTPGNLIKRAIDRVNAELENTPRVEHPNIPSSDRPVEEIISAAQKHFTRLKNSKDAARWRKVRLRGEGPMGIVWMGDPHTDNPGCDWVTLQRDIDLIRDTEGMFCANAGDSVDNWVGRLIKYHGKSFVTVKEAWRLAEWLLDELEHKWVAWVIGNHDEWNDGTHIFERMGSRLIQMDDWNARLTLEFDNGRTCPIHMAHDFAGHSQFNPLHGMKKADLWNVGHAQIYLGGHKHETALFRYPCPIRKKPIIFGRAMGYKAIDGYGDKLGYSRQDEGESIAVIFDQDAPDEAKFVQAFTDIEEATDFLKYKRAKAGV